jgi:hypothetical protein
MDFSWVSSVTTGIPFLGLVAIATYAVGLSPVAGLLASLTPSRVNSFGINDSKSNSFLPKGRSRLSQEKVLFRVLPSLRSKLF